MPRNRPLGSIGRAAALALKPLAAEVGADRPRKPCVVRDSKLAPEWSEAERRTLSIAGRAVASLVTTQGVGDIFRIQATAERDKMDFILADIPDESDAPHPRESDPACMRAPFQPGNDLAAEGYRRVKRPPGM